MPEDPVAASRQAEPGHAAVLSSLSAQARDLTEKVAAEGESLNRDTTEQAALSLFEAERALRTAQRAIDRAGRQLD